MAAPTRDAPASARAVANSRSPVAAATARKIAVVTSDPTELEGDGASLAVRGGVSLATADLTMGMLLGLAYRMVEADRFTRAGHFKQEQTLALMGVGCPEKTVGKNNLLVAVRARVSGVGDQRRAPAPSNRLG
jgi:hypothetical protein